MEAIPSAGLFEHGTFIGRPILEADLLEFLSIQAPHGYDFGVNPRSPVSPRWALVNATTSRRVESLSAGSGP